MQVDPDWHNECWVRLCRRQTAGNISQGKQILVHRIWPGSDLKNKFRTQIRIQNFSFLTLEVKKCSFILKNDFSETTLKFTD